MAEPELTPEELAAEATRTVERLQATALWLVEWMRDPEPEMRLRPGGTVEHAFELAKGLADLATLLATQVGVPLGLSAEDVVQQVAGASNDPDLARAIAARWLDGGDGSPVPWES